VPVYRLQERCLRDLVQSAREVCGIEGVQRARERVVSVTECKVRERER